jgi:hypothetical protein
MSSPCEPKFFRHFHAGGYFLKLVLPSNFSPACIEFNINIVWAAWRHTRVEASISSRIEKTLRCLFSIQKFKRLRRALRVQSSEATQKDIEQTVKEESKII